MSNVENNILVMSPNFNDDSFRQLVDDDLYVEIIGNEILSKELGRSPVEGFTLSIDKKTHSWQVILAIFTVFFTIYLIHSAIWSILTTQAP